MPKKTPTTREIWEKHTVWQKPLYPFRIPTGLDTNDKQTFAEIYIDVTGSAPSFDTPGSYLSNVFEELLKKFPKTKKLQILDFGAGKLRNTIYFLEKGHTVYACEYENLKNSSKHAKTLFAKADDYSKRFKEYIFPEEFIKSKEQFDLILLINVLNVMPVPAERWLVLLHCHQRLNKDGLILWYSQFGDKDQRNRCTDENKISDGWYMGKNSRYKTFYREFFDPEIKGMFLSCGFDYVESIKVPHNQARLFKKRRNAPLKRILDAKLIESLEIIDVKMTDPIVNEPKIFTDGEKSDLFHDGKYKICIPNPDNLSFEYLLQECLTKIPTGNKGADANDYETVIALLLSQIFKEDLKNLTLQEDINEGRKRIDFVMTNDAKDGFFWHLSERHQLKCPYIIFECKNYTEDLKNGEFDQLTGRLKRKIGQVGIIVCRSIEDKNKCLKTQQDAYPDFLILVLEDADIHNLLDYQSNDDRDELIKYLDDKAKAVILSK